MTTQIMVALTRGFAHLGGGGRDIHNGKAAKSTWKDMQVDWSQMQQLFRALGFDKAPPRDVVMFREALETWRNRYETPNGQPGAKLIKRENSSVQEGLKDMATKFLYNEHNDLRFWSPGRSWSRPGDLRCPEDSEEIIRLLTETFWRRNLDPIHAAWQEITTDRPSHDAVAPEPYAEVITPSSEGSRPATSSSQTSIYAPSQVDIYDVPDEPVGDNLSRRSLRKRVHAEIHNVNDEHDGRKISRKILGVHGPPGLPQLSMDAVSIDIEDEFRRMETEQIGEMTYSSEYITGAVEQEESASEASQIHENLCGTTTITQNSFVQYDPPSRPSIAPMAPMVPMAQQANQANQANQTTKRPQKKPPTGPRKGGRSRKIQANAQNVAISQNSQLPVPQILQSSSASSTNETRSASTTEPQLGRTSLVISPIESTPQTQAALPSHATLPTQPASTIQTTLLSHHTMPPTKTTRTTQTQTKVIPSTPTVPPTHSTTPAQAAPTNLTTSPTLNESPSNITSHNEATPLIRTTTPVKAGSSTGNVAKEVIQPIYNSIYAPRPNDLVTSKDRVDDVAAAVTTLANSMDIVQKLVNESMVDIFDVEKKKAIVQHLTQIYALKSNNTKTMVSDVEPTVESLVSDQAYKQGLEPRSTSENAMVISTPPTSPNSPGHIRRDSTTRLINDVSNLPISAENTISAQSTQESNSSPNTLSKSSKPQSKGSLRLWVVTHYPRYAIERWEDGKFVNATLSDITNGIAKLKRVPRDQIVKIEVELCTTVCSTKFSARSDDEDAWKDGKKMVVRCVRQAMKDAPDETRASGRILIEPIYDQHKVEVLSDGSHDDIDDNSDLVNYFGSLF
ncbi:hypothetical protein B7463_g10549, partial [Scytalidium lignicola]